MLNYCNLHDSICASCCPSGECLGMLKRMKGFYRRPGVWGWGSIPWPHAKSYLSDTCHGTLYAGLTSKCLRDVCLRWQERKNQSGSWVILTQDSVHILLNEEVGKAPLKTFSLIYRLFLWVLFNWLLSNTFSSIFLLSLLTCCAYTSSSVGHMRLSVYRFLWIHLFVTHQISAILDTCLAELDYQSMTLSITLSNFLVSAVT